MNLVSTIYHNKLFETIFPTHVYVLKEELKDCESVLDLGCGPDSPLQYCMNIKHSVGVEAFLPYLEETQKREIHSEYLNKKIADLDFDENSFDAVIMLEVIEHMEESEGMEVLKKLEKWARKKVIISTPNGFFPQKVVDNNPMQVHLSGWDIPKMKSLGFNKFKGLAGLKYLRAEIDHETMGDDLFISMKYKPKFLWFIIATLSQILTYRLPNLAFGLFCVKTKNN